MIEKKLLIVSDVKFAASDEATTGLTFSGYGAAFDNVDAYGDVIVKGAFKKTLAEFKRTKSAPLMFLNHDMFSLPIGKWTKMEEDDFGLKVEGEFLDTNAGRDAYTASKAGAITGLSIGWRPVDVTIGKSSDEPRRVIKTADLLEISVVTFPANGKARISDIKSFGRETNFEAELLRLGMDAEEAKSFMASVILSVEDKYTQAEEMKAARNLLLKLQGAK